MEDNTMEIVRENCESVSDPLNLTPSGNGSAETRDESVNMSDTRRISNESQGRESVSGRPMLPILEKIDDLSDKIQTLRVEHTVLSKEVKDITMNSFPGSEVLNALQQLSEEHELLKKKHLQECDLLKKKHLDEYVERRRLYNEVIELKGNIRVFCRCRPLNQDELANGSTSVVEITPSQEHEMNIICADSTKKQFKFDYVFGPHATQDDVFAQTSPIVTSVLDGYNVCIFAYGQTGTGKTFTMEGTPENRGVNYRTLKELFRMADQRSGTMRYEISVSMLEVYNERIRDLLLENSNESSKKLEVKQTPEGTQEVPGLVEARVYGTDGVWELLKTGSRVRSVGSTNANELSSRSHCLLRVTVKGENMGNDQRTKSNLWLVDLAGSERVGRIEVEGERLKESQFINKSLSALGDVISSLASKSAHIPYRNSKLTHILQSSLGGDCKTLMFVQISPSDTDFGETLCSLNFATRVKGIEHGPARKQTDVSELLKYKHMAEKLKQDEKEKKKLQENVQSLQLKLAAREHICKNLQEKVRELENQLTDERKIRMKQETKTLAAVSSKPPKQPLKPAAEKKPPLGPSNLRFPLRRISNFIPPPSSIQPKKSSNVRSLVSCTSDDKENISDEPNSKSMRGPRRVSYAVRPPAQTTVSGFQPRRRVSVATLRPDPGLLASTPLKTQPAKHDNGVLQRPSFFREASRVRRFSKVFAPIPETPMSSRKFMGSPPSVQHGSWKPKHTTAVVLPKKPLVWSPLKSRNLKNLRKSIV